MKVLSIPKSTLRSFRVLLPLLALVLTAGVLSLNVTRARVGNSSSTQPSALVAASQKLPANQGRRGLGPVRATQPPGFELLDFRSGNIGLAFFVPNINAVKSAVLAVGGDVNGNGFVNPGDKLTYTVVVNNTGTDASNVVITDILNGNLTLEPGSVTVSPLAFNDSYASLGNVGINVPVGSGLLVNDLNLQGSGTIGITPGTIATSGGGSAVVSSNGAFTYNPAAGFEGTDTFTYTLTHSNGKTDTGSVSIVVSGMVWFINNNAAACTTLGGGCGRLSNPFSSLAAFQALNNGTGLNPAAGDTIFLYESVTAYTGGVTLLNNQKLIGQDATVSVDVAAGLTVPPFSNPLPAGNSSNGILVTLTNTGAGNSAITTAQGNRIQGMTIGDTGANDITGSNFGTLTIRDLTLSGTGRALNLNNGTLNAIIASITSNNSTATGITLTNLLTTSSLTVSGTTTVDNPAASTNSIVIDTVGSGSTLTFTGAVNINNRKATGIFIDNAQGTFSFGATTIANPNNAGGYGIRVEDSSAAVTFASATISNTNQTVATTDPGNDGAPDTDGDGDAIFLKSTTGSFTLNGGTLSNLETDGIDCRNCRNLSITNVTISQIGVNSSNPTAVDDAGLFAFNLTGTNLIKDSVITRFEGQAAGGLERGIYLLNATGNTLTELRINNTDFTNTTAPGLRGDDGISFRGQGTASAKIIVENTCTFSNLSGLGIEIDTDAGATGTIELDVFDSTFNSAFTAAAGSFQGGIDVQTAGSPTVDVEIRRSTFTGLHQGNANAGIIMFAPQQTAGSYTAVVDGCTITGTLTGGGRTGRGAINLRTGDLAGEQLKNLTFTINNCDINDIGDDALYLDIRGESLTGAGATAGNVRITNNRWGTVTPVGQDQLEGVTIRVRNTLTTAVKTVNLLFDNNQIRNNDNSTGDETVDIDVEQNATLNATVTGNTFRSNGSASNEFAATTENTTSTMCLDLRNNTATQGAGPAGNGTMLIDESSGTLNYRQSGNSPAPTTAGSPTIIATGCTLPALMAPMETEAAPQDGGNNSVSVFQRARKWLPVAFSAFTAPTNFSLSKLGNWFTPVVTAAERKPVATTESPVAAVVTPRAASSERVSPTAIIPVNAAANAAPVAAAALAGETITVPPSGNFTLPAGKSVTVMFNATISSGYTSTSINNQASVAGSNFSTVTSNNLSTPVIQAPTFSKAFNPTTIATNTGVSTLTFTLVNPNPSQALSSVSFSDPLPPGAEVAATPAVSTTGCGSPTFAPAAAATNMTFSGGSIAAGGTCTATVNVRATAEGVYANLASGVTSTQANASGTAAANLTVMNAPSFSKAFGSPTIPLNGTTSLTFNITNNSAFFQLTGIDFTDTLPAGLVVATPNGLSTTCGGTATATAGGNTISLTGVTRNATTSCTLTVNVTGTTAGPKNNTATLATTQLGASSASTGTVTLTVLSPPTISKSFGTSPIVTGQTSVLTINVTNPNPGHTLSGISFTDTLPAGVTAANGTTTTCGGGTLNIASNVITLTGGSILASSNCSIPVTTTGVQVGTFTNTISSVSSTNGGTNSTPATANITINKANTTASITADPTDPSVVGQPYSVTASVSVTAPGSATPTAPTGTITVSDGSQTCTITLPATSCNLTSTTAGAKNLTATYNGDSNFNASAASAAEPHTVNKANTTTAITSDLPDPSSPGQSVTVNFTVTANSPGSGTPTGNVTVTVSGGAETCTGTVAAGTCNITLTGTGLRTLTATYVGDANYNGSASAGTPHTVTVPLQIAKGFAPTQVKVNEVSVMTFTLTNNNTSSASNISFSDTFPAGLEVDTTSFTPTNTCGGVFNPALTNGATTLNYQGGSLAGSGATCTITVQVKGTSPGLKDNQTGPISSTENGTGNTSNLATLTVVGAPVLAKSFSPNPVVLGQASTLTFTVTNNNTTVALSGIQFTDTLPAGITVATSGPTAACNGGSFTTTAPSTISFSGGSLAAGNPTPTTCTFNVTVGTTAVGALLNTTGVISATESGPGATAQATLTVNKANTTTTISNATTLASTPTVVGESYPVSVLVAAVAPGAGVPGGTVNVSDGTGGSCVITLSGGAGTCNLTSTSAGPKTISATYVGDANFNGSGPATASHTVNKANTTTLITNAAALGSTPTVVGQSYAVNWSVSVNSPGALGVALTGNVTVDAGGGNTCTAAVSAGTCNIVSTTAGLKSITATYAGDTNYNGSASAGASHTVNKADTTTTITNAAALGSTPTVVGQSYAVNWSVSVNAPGALGAALTGNVTVSDGSQTCTAAVSAGTCNLTSTTSGTKTITATYTGDTNYNGSTSAGATHSVGLPGTTTTITADTPDPSVVGQAYNVAVTVTVNAPGMGTPTGTVTISDGTGGTCNFTLSAGAGNCNLTSTTAGAKTLTAVYAGDSNFNGSTSAGAPHTVNKANTTIGSFTDSPDPSVVGQPYTVGFTLSVASPGAGTPTGTVTVNDGTGGTCTATLPATTCSLTSTSAGIKTLTFTYNGDANFNTSSNTAGHQVNKASTTVAITADTPDPSVIGQNYAVTASVSVSSPGAGTPTGTITVSDGTNNCTITLPATSCNLPSTSVGAKTLTATYNGDANFNGSGPSAGVPHTVNKADVTVTITSDNPDSSAVGQNVTVAFTVAASAPGAGTPTGTVTITISGGSETCTGTLAAGSGSCTLALTTPGDRTLTATYNGDSNYNTGTDTEPHTVVGPPTIVKVFTPSSTPINGTSTLSITISNPAANTVALTGVSFTDNFPANLVVANPLTITNTCSGTLQDGGGGALNAGDTGIRLTGGSVGISSSCTVSVNVTPTAAGPHVNTTGNVTSANGGTGNTATSTLQTNTPPTISSNTVLVKAGSSATPFTIATAVDPDQAVNTLGITINGNPTTASSNGVTVSGVAIQPSGAVTANIATTCAATSATFNLVVTDNQSATGTGTLTVTVTTNMPPMLTYSPQTLVAGTTLNFNPLTGPTDNGTINPLSVQSIVPPTGLTATVNPTTGQVAITSATLNGSYVVTIAATDNCGSTTLAPITVTVTCPTIALTPTSLPGGTVGSTYSQSVSASPSGTTYSYAVTSGALPPGLSLNPATGEISGSPTQSGSFNFRLTATGFGTCTGFRDYSITVTCPTITLTPTSLPGGTVGTNYNQSVTASPAGTYSYSVTVGSLPTGVTLNPATGALTGLLTTPGTYNFTISATTGNCVGSRAYAVTITCPTITFPASLPAGTAGNPYAGSVAVSPAGSYTYSILVGSLPTGVTLNPATGALTGTPLTTGTFNVTFKADAGNGCSASQALSLVIGCPTVTVSPTSLPDGAIGVGYNQFVSATPVGGSYTFAVSAGALPPGLALNPTTGQIIGTPTTAGAFNFSITATGFGSCPGTRGYTINIPGSGGCPTITLPDLPNGTAGSLYVEYALASPSETYTYMLTGTLPPGLTFFDAIGLIYGYPTTAGTFSFTIKATDSNGCMGSKAYSVTIGVGLLPSALPDATQGWNYTQAFKPLGVSGSATFSLKSGRLPQGVSMSAQGELTGKPTEKGTFPLEVLVTDAFGKTGVNSVKLNVNGAADAPNVAARLADPLACTQGGSLVQATALVSNPSGQSQSTTFTSTLPEGLKALPGTCTADSGTCTVVNESTVSWAGTLAAGASVTIRYQAQVVNETPTGAQLCTLSTASFNGGGSASAPACLTLNCPAAGPGLALNSRAPLSDQKAGSVLFYNIYTSSSTNANSQNTRISLTNTHVSLPAQVHLFFVDGVSCSIADSYICLTANQTATFLASDLDPGTTGYLVAIAVDANGCPTNFNYLIGDEYVKFQSGHTANLGAQAVSAIAGGLPACDANATTATLNFDGRSYNVLPRVLALDNVASRADGNDTMLVVNRIGGNLATGASTLGTLFGILYDDAENGLSFSVNGGCQLRGNLSNTFPRTAPRFEQFIPAGRSGWLRLYSQSDIGIVGAAINFNANAGAQANAFNQGHNLHILTNTANTSVVIPVFPPSC